MFSFSGLIDSLNKKFKNEGLVFEHIVWNTANFISFNCAYVEYSIIQHIASELDEVYPFNWDMQIHSGCTINVKENSISRSDGSLLCIQIK
jgi:hypothetical protein